MTLLSIKKDKKKNITNSMTQHAMPKNFAIT